MLKADAIRFFDGPTKLSKLLGLKSRQAIYAWPDVVPDLYQYKLHHLSGGKLPIDVAPSNGAGDAPAKAAA